MTRLHGQTHTNSGVMVKPTITVTSTNLGAFDNSTVYLHVVNFIVYYSEYYYNSTISSTCDCHHYYTGWMYYYQYNIFMQSTEGFRN